MKHRSTFFLEKSVTNKLKKYSYRMLETKDNYQNLIQDVHCPLCDDGITLDSQEHVLVCPAIVH